MPLLHKLLLPACLAALTLSGAACGGSASSPEQEQSNPLGGSSPEAGQARRDMLRNQNLGALTAEVPNDSSSSDQAR